jgi:hypothetical protein
MHMLNNAWDVYGLDWLCVCVCECVCVGGGCACVCMFGLVDSLGRLDIGDNSRHTIIHEYVLAWLQHRSVRVCVVVVWYISLYSKKQLPFW